MSGRFTDRDCLLVLGASALTALFAGLIAWRVSGTSGAHPDFAMTWTAAQQTNPYDPAALNSVLNWGARDEAAFAYPPTALSIYGAFALLPLRVGLLVWAALSGMAMGLASRSRWSPLLLLVPAVLWALPGGQASVLLGSLLLGSLLLLRRPVPAGILLGIALSLKPQLALVVPIALLVDRRWPVLISATITYSLFALVSALIFGPAQWLHWIQSLPGFLARLEANPFWRVNEIVFGLPLWLRTAIQIVGGWLAAQAIRRESSVEAFVIAVSAGLLGSPHAMGYEFAMFAPAVPALLAGKEWSAPATVIFLLVPVLIWAGLPAYPFRLLAVGLLAAATAVDGALRPGIDRAALNGNANRTGKT